MANRGRSSLVSLVATGLRGLRSRSLLTVGSVLLAAIAVAAAVVGPMYQTASAASYLVSKLRLQPDFLSGVTLDFKPAQRVSAALAQQRAEAAVKSADLSSFSGPEQSLWSQRLAISTPVFAGANGADGVLAAPPDCRQLVITGHCPRQPGEALLLQFDAQHTSSSVGDRIAMQGVKAPLVVVGTYRLRTSDIGRFDDPSRFISALPQPTAGEDTPYHPAPFVVAPATVAGLQQGLWFVRMDYQLQVTPGTTLGDLQEATRQIGQVRALQHHPSAAGRVKVEPGNQLRSIVADAKARRDTAVQTVTPAVLSLILVALVLLGRLLMGAMELRRPELALASLRGIGRRQLWVLGLLEPVLVLVIATPIGIAGGYAGARILAADWLVPGLPLHFGLSSVVFAALVVAVTLVIAAAIVRSALAEPLSSQIAGVRRPGRSGRWGVLTRLAVVAAAIVVLAATLRPGQGSQPAATDEALPILLAVAVGLLTTLGVAYVAGWQARRSTRRRSLTGYVATRAVSRRREGTWAILPLAAALAIAVFAAGIYATAANWRASDAVTRVGADMSYSVDVPLAQALALTHQIDPQGRWLMAAAADSDGNGLKVLADTPRLARVAVWPSSWTPGLSASDLSAALSPREPPLTLTGHRVQLTVDNAVQASTRSLLLTLNVVTATGLTESVLVGPFPQGNSTRSAPMPCSAGCQVGGLSIGGPGPFAVRMHGSVTISDLRADGTAVPYFTGVGWRDGNTDSKVYGPAAVTGTRATSATLTATLDSQGNSAVAQLVPADVPAALPVLLGRTAAPRVLSSAGKQLTVATSAQVAVTVSPVGTTESMPYFGPAAMLVDATMYTRSVPLTNVETAVHILARGDTPPSVIKGLAAHGITSPVRLDDVRRALDQDAYALALKLYAVVTVLVMLLALAGLAVNMAVQIPARRRDAASLRVVGLPRRSIVSAVIAELTAVLGAAAVAGIAAGVLSQYVVVRTLTLGYADNLLTPRVLPALDVAKVTLLLVAAFAVLLCVAVALGNLTIRGARTATLRENAT